MRTLVRSLALAVVTAGTAGTAVAQMSIVGPVTLSPLASFRVRSLNVPSTGQEVLYNAGPAGVTGQKTAGGVLTTGATFSLARAGDTYTFNFLSGWAGNTYGASQPFVVTAAGANALRFNVQSASCGTNVSCGGVSFSNLTIGGTSVADLGVAAGAGSLDAYYAAPTGDFTVTGTLNFSAPLAAGEAQRFEINAYADPGLTDLATVPEPSTYALMGTGLAGLLTVARRRARRA